MEDVVVVIAEINKHLYFRYNSSFYEQFKDLIPL